MPIRDPGFWLAAVTLVIAASAGVALWSLSARPEHLLSRWQGRAVTDPPSAEDERDAAVGLARWALAAVVLALGFVVGLMLGIAG